MVYMPTDVIYEATFDLHVPVFCYICPGIHLAFRSYTGIINKAGVEKIQNKMFRKCH